MGVLHTPIMKLKEPGDDDGADDDDDNGTRQRVKDRPH